VRLRSDYFYDRDGIGIYSYSGEIIIAYETLSSDDYLYTDYLSYIFEFIFNCNKVTVEHGNWKHKLLPRESKIHVI